MKKLFALLSLLAFLSCTPPWPSPNPASTPHSIDLAGQQGLFLQGGGASHSLARSITAPSGAVLMKVTASTATEATFLDDLGNPVTVTVTRTLQLSPDYLLMEYSFEGASAVAIVTLATGDLRAPSPLPDNWERIRVRAGLAYYVAGGHLQRVDLATLAAVDMSQGDVISSSSLIFLDGAGNAHTFYLVNGLLDVRNQIRIYFADGSPPDVLGWGSPTAYRVCDPSPGVSVLEDEAAGTVFFVSSDASGLHAIPVSFDATGVYEGTSQILDAALIGADTTYKPTASKPYLDNVAFSDGSDTATLTVSAGAISGSITRAIWTYDQPTVYQGGKVYTASATGIDTMDMASGVAAQIVAEAGITAIDVVGEDVFFATASGVYQRDSTGAVTLYSAAPVDIETVME